MKVLFAGGGTGGHVFPAIAVAEELLNRDGRTQVMFVGSDRGIEARLLPERGYPFESMVAGALKGLSLSKKMSTLRALPGTIRIAGQIVNRFAPDVVVGIGGYASAPAVIAARWQGRSAMLLEQNFVPGLTNRLLAFGVSWAAVNFEDSARFFPGNAVVTGNPIRKEFFRVGPPPADAPFSVLIFGGSQGAHAINQGVADALPLLGTIRKGVHFIHQTGEKEFEMVRAAYAANHFAADVRLFFDDMPQQFERASLVIGRAGASSLSEIAATGRASILIPLPTAADDHQRKNASVFVERRAALLLEQSTLNGDSLARSIRTLYENSEQRRSMAAAAAALSRPDAASRIADLIAALGGSPPRGIH